MAGVVRVLVAAGWLAACGTADGPGPSPAGETGEGARPRGDVVSVVAGRPITVQDVARVSRATGLPPRQALERLQAQELLALEAERRGHAERDEVRRARKRAMVHQLLAREVEAPAADGDVGAVDGGVPAEGDAGAVDGGVPAADAALTRRRRERLGQLLKSLRARFGVQRNEEAIRRALRMELRSP